MSSRLSEEDRLELSDPSTRADALRRLASEPAKELSEIMTCLVDEDPLVRAAFLDYITAHSDHVQIAPDLLRSTLMDTDGLVRTSAIECVVALQDGGALDKIGQLLTDDDELVRSYAAWAIGALEGARLEGILRHQYSVEKSERVRVAIAESLYRFLADDQLLTYLIDQLRNIDPEVRAFVTNSLVGIANEENVDPIRAAMSAALSQETNEVVRENMKRDLVLLGSAIGGTDA